MTYFMPGIAPFTVPHDFPSHQLHGPTRQMPPSPALSQEADQGSKRLGELPEGAHREAAQPGLRGGDLTPNPADRWEQSGTPGQCPVAMALSQEGSLKTC